MLPPVDDSVLQSNPRFAALHATLSTNILNPNGSTKHHPAQKERDAMTVALRVAQIRFSKNHLITTTLCNLDLSSPSSSTSTISTRKSSRTSQTQTTLPPELCELILLLSSQLTSPPLPPASKALLESTTTWASLPHYLPQISLLLSAHLQSSALALCRILTPTTNPSYLHRTIPKLVSTITSLRSSIQSQKSQLSTRRLALVSKTTTLLSLSHLSTTLLILSLEQTKHGLLSRHIKARTEYLSLLAATLVSQAKEKLIKGEKLVYTEEVKGALSVYSQELRGGMERLREKRGDAERVLWGYGVGREEGEKEKVMREIARVYGELKREVEEVGKDVERLKGK